MSSDEEDDAPRASFGGMKRSSEAAMLGVFGDSDSDDGGGKPQRSQKQARGDTSKPMAARPMSFVSGGKQERKAEPAGPTIQPPPPPPPPPKQRAGLGAAAAAPPPLPGEKVDRDFATFEAHGKGFGTRMLEKMGWTKGQGIGKSGHGVVNPLESKLRPNSMGLGFGGFKETTAKAKLQQERILHADSERAQLSDESDEELARERRRQGLPAKGASSSSSAAGPEPKRQHWKRHERRELQVKSAADLRQQWAQKDAAAAAASASAASSSATTTTILDMRGPEARVHSSISSALAAQLGDSSAGSSAAVPLTASGLPRADVCPELRHNMRTYIDLAEQELDKKHRELRKEKEALAELTQRRDTQASAARATAARLHEVTQLSQAVKDATHAASEAIARAKAAASANASAAAEATPSSSSSSAESVLVPLEEAAAGWLKVRKEHPEGFATRGLSDVAASMVVEPMRMAFRGWRPLHEPKFGVAMMKGWQKALGGGALGGELLAAGGSGAQALAAGGGQGSSAYEALVYLTVMPALRGSLANEWRVRSSDEAIRLLEAWRPVLPDGLWRPLFSAQVMPRLASELNSWQPKTDTTPPHHWLHPWLPLLPPPGLSELYPQLRHKLSTALGALGISEPSAVALLTPWKTALDQASWQALIGRQVLPKLQHALSKELVINPAAQDVSPLIGVLQWGSGSRPKANAGLILDEQLAALLLKHFFPKWLSTLSEWLNQGSDSIDFGEIGQWYSGWKSLLHEHCPKLVERHSGVRQQLNTALALINDALTAGDDDEPPPPPPPPAADWDGDEDDDLPPPPPPPGEPPPPPPPPPAILEGDDEMSLRQSLEALATVHELVLMPTGMRHEGKQVFKFGEVPVYIDPVKKIVCAKVEGGKFQPTSLGALIEAATAGL